MRIPTAAAFDRSIDAINQRRAEVTKIQEQMSSGSRLSRLADDPGAAAQAEHMRSQRARLDAEQRMVDYAKLMLQQAEGAIGSAGDELQTVREGLLQAANGTLSAADRASIAQQLRGSQDRLMAIANSRDGAGGYIFGGAGATSDPFTTSGGVVYGPQSTPLTVATDPQLALTQDGSSAFMNVPTPTGTVTVFKVLSDAIALLEDPTATGAAITAGVKSAIDGVDAGMSRLQSQRTMIGESLRNVDQQTNTIADQSASYGTRLSELTDVDYAKAISDLATNQTALDAAMKTYTQISKMSLFQYL